MVAHLNIHTSYDLLNSSVDIKRIVSKAKAIGYSAIAITDLNVMYGIPQFYDACIQAEIKPLLGITVYVTDDLVEKEAVILAKSNQGLKNLFKLSSEINTQQRAYLNINEIGPFIKETVVIFKSMDESSSTWLKGLPESTTVYVDTHSQISNIQKVWIESTIYEDSEDADTIDVLAAIRDNTKLNLVGPPQFPNQHLKSLDEIESLQIPHEWLSVTDEIAQLCQATLNYHQSLLPEFKTSNELSSDDYLWMKLQQAMKEKRLLQSDYQSRVLHEFKTIQSMGFSDYFLIVSDLINYAKNNGVMVGPGRGSSAGSLVSYLLNITTIDPLKYDLLFERFLNPERVTMPDIDIDFEDTQREKVIQYVQQKYGDYKVAGIVTFGHLLAKAVARDVGRVMGFDESTLSEASKLIPSKLGVTLDEAYATEAFKQFVHRNHRHEQWFKLCKKLEGLPRNTSTHAAGVIVNDHPLYETIPLTQGDTGILTQWTMTEAERIGLLKIDFLGLRNLTIIHQVIKQIQKDQNHLIDIESIPFDDQSVFELLSKGDTTGIFQLESEGVRRVLQKLKPQHFEDIVAVTSLYRPGPMEEIPTYIRRRHQPSEVSYLHPDLEPILKRTYGVIIYQEQIMQIASQFAGFSYGEADILRRAMSKKNRAVLENERQHFIEGATSKGYEQSLSEEIFDLVLKFADYGFPRAHAVSYSKIAYIMSYLKVHYASYFYANILSNVIGNESKTAQMVYEAKQQKIRVHGPHVNQSQWRYRAVNNEIYISLGAIKGIGYQSVQIIVKERIDNGPYKDFFDFCQRIPARIRSRRLLEALILSGAMDCFKKNRATLLQSIDQINDSQSDLDQSFLEAFSTTKQDYQETEEMPDHQKSEYEKHYLGFYVSTHPAQKAFQLKQYLGVFPLTVKAQNAPILVTIDDVRVIRTKKGQQMAFLALNDGLRHMDGVLFPNTFQKIEATLTPKKLYVVEGKFEQRNHQHQLIIQRLDTLENYEAKRLGTARKIVTRQKLPVSIYKEVLVAQVPQNHSTSDYLNVAYFDNKSNTTKPIGYVNRKYLTKMIQAFEPHNIRLL
ncbi:DNA polymerase III subunit alpha [Staphylococcus chromogenes]|uniref:DNA polymerase III subunit alpha n=1 Tax=Staphylococcus chromogenes TaxID=46126 RepID=UPI000D1BAE6B|nr:DNA polymerase III subunit alpha [Staphylococcus chromogenes]PTG10463.1 DNA polymerase III subunit alpha [Staphylococcus chromogenes]